MTRKPETIAFWRGQLPHWEGVEGRYFVTMHLAGAIPPAGQERIRTLSAEMERLPDNNADSRLKVQRRVFAEMEAWLDRAAPVSHLQRPEVAQIVMEAIAFRQGRVWNMLEFVLMPSHLHLFFELTCEGLKKHMEQFKRWTAHETAKLLNLDANRFCQDEWFDHWSRSGEEDERILQYIRRNPKRAGLVKNYLDWPFGGWKLPPVAAASRAAAESLGPPRAP